MELQVLESNRISGDLLLDLYESVKSHVSSNEDSLLSTPATTPATPTAPPPLPTQMLSEDSWERVLLAAVCEAQDMSRFVVESASVDNDLAYAPGAPYHGQLVDALNIRLVADGAAGGWRRQPYKYTEFFDTHTTDAEVAHLTAVTQNVTPRLRDRNGKSTGTKTHVYGTRVSVEALRESGRRMTALSLINKSSRDAVRRFLFHPVLGEQSFSETAADVETSVLVRRHAVLESLPSVLVNTPHSIAIYVRRSRVTFTSKEGFLESDEYAPASMLWALFQGVRLSCVAAESSARTAQRHVVNAIKLTKREQNAHNSLSADHFGSRAPVALQPVSGYSIAWSDTQSKGVLAYDFVHGSRNEWFDTSTVLQRFNKRAALVTLLRDRICRHQDRDVVEYRRAVANGIKSASDRRGPRSRPDVNDRNHLKQIDNAAVFAFECERTSFDVQKLLPVTSTKTPMPFRLVVEFVGDGRTLHTLVGGPFLASTRRLCQSARDEVSRKRKASMALATSK